MIDLENAKKIFAQYVRNYDHQNEKVALKINHTYRVMQQAQDIAISLKLSEDEVALASLIGLLHDIGRFEQLKRYDSYIDSQTVDHANLGVKILFDEGLIEAFKLNELEAKVVKTAIYNHNKYAIEDNLDELSWRHCQIIRDSDKVDIFYTGLIEDFTAFLNTTKAVLENDVISDHVYDTFMSCQTVLSTTRVTPLDHWVSFLALCFDLNYEYANHYVYQNNFINKLINRLDYQKDETKQRMQQIQQCANNYLKQR